MDALFEDKLSLLQLYYPKSSPDFLREVLSSCGADLDRTRALIDGLPRPLKRRASAQAQLTGIVGKRCKTDIRSTSGLRESRACKRSPRLEDTTCSSPEVTRSASKVITVNTPEDVRVHLEPYVSLHLNFLPHDLSVEVSKDYLQQQEQFKQKHFYLFGNQCHSSSTTAIFARPKSRYFELTYNGLKCSSHPTYTDAMELVARHTEAFINEEVIPNSKRRKWNPEIPWENDFSVVNCYEKLENSLAWHSDRLSHIGPLNYIATISLGTTRMFRLRSIYKRHSPIYQIPLPHNSLLLMRPGCQEEYKHCVSPMSKPVATHPLLGTKRFGITARCYPTFFIENSPKCRCGIGMLLRRSYKSLDTRGRYFWSCGNTYQNKDCNTFHWCDFTNIDGQYIAKDVSEVSVWIAPEDEEKISHDRSTTSHLQKDFMSEDKH